jgi:hypothetical protein
MSSSGVRMLASFTSWHGWDALVAIGTLSLAGVTFLLVWATVRLGKRALEETQAQWRPVIAIHETRSIRRSGSGSILAQHTDLGLSPRQDGMDVVIENLGRGPAIGISLFTDPRQKAHAHISLLAPGDIAAAVVPTAGDESDPFALLISYSDISGGGCTTRVIASRDARLGPKIEIQVFEFRPPLGLAWSNIVPRRWRATLTWPINKRILRRRGYYIP